MAYRAAAKGSNSIYLQGRAARRFGRGDVRAVLDTLWRRFRLSIFGVSLGLAGCVLLVIAGCSSSSTLQLGQISVTNPTGAGQVTSVIVNTTANVSITVINSGTALGVDWSITCGGSPTPVETTNVCGTLNPVHVGSSINMIYTAPSYVPIGNTVTLTAQATGDPSVSSSITLTILPQPVALTWLTGNTPVTNLAAGGTQQLAVTVANDPISAGVNWSVSCGSTSCGSFSTTLTASSQTTTYTAPASIPSGGTVQVTATSVYDSTKSISVTITIQPIAVTTSISPTPLSAGEPATLTATVLWDVSGAGATWGAPSCSAASCGTIQGNTCSPAGPPPQYATTCTAQYTSPASIPAGDQTLPVSVVATSNAQSSANSLVTFSVGPPKPITVSVSASPATVQVNGTSTLTATVNYDYTNAGVNWQCSPGTCSSTSSTTLPFTTTYTAPPSVPTPDPVTVTATSIAAPASDPTRTASASVNVVPAISVTMAGSNPTSITAGQAAQFSATVTNDIAPGGVNWSAACSGTTNCGTFTPGGQTSNGNNTTYTVSFTASTQALWSDFPNVTITATSAASLTVPPVQSASSVATVTPVTFIEFVPFLPSALPASNATASSLVSENIIAVSANDQSHEGVTWTVCAKGTNSCTAASGACTGSTAGQFLINSGAPAIQTANPVRNVAAVPPTCSNTIHVASGQAVSYLPPSTVPSSGAVTFTVTSTANPSATTSQNVAITSSLSGVALQGTVQIGSAPVAGAQVSLYQAGNSGNGSAASPVPVNNGANSVTTGQNGTFSIPAGYACNSPGSLLYLVAVNGNPGGAGANAQLGLITALGPCANLNSSTPIVINEVTTVASIWALAPFIGNENPNGYSPEDYQYIGSSSGNYGNGLANAFAAVNNLVNITNGQSLLFTPGGGSFTPPGPAATTPVMNGLVPQAEINTLADAVNSCAATSGFTTGPGDGSPCDTFFYAANVNPNAGGLNHENEPTSILSALIAIARRPGSSLNASLALSGIPIYSIAASEKNPPYTPILSGAPSDWTIALTFSGGGLEGARRAGAGPAAMAIDGSGNLWIANQRISSVTQLTNLGVALSPYATGYLTGDGGGFTGGGLSLPEQIAIDPYGNAWVLNSGNSLTEIDPLGVPVNCGANPDPACGGSTLSTPFSGAGNANNTSVGLAIDASGNVWVTDSGSPGDVAKYAGFNGGAANGQTVTNGSPLSPAGAGFTTLTSANDPLDTNPANPNAAIVLANSLTAGAVNGEQEVWLLDQGNYAAVALNTSGGLLQVDHGFQTDTPPPPSNPLFSSSNFGNTIATDKSGNVFIPSANGAPMFELYPCTSAADPNCLGLGAAAFNPSDPFAPQVAIDGADNLWLMTGSCSGCGPGGVGNLPAALTEYSESGTIVNANVQLYGYVGPPNSVGESSGSTAQSVAVDTSGNVWLLFNGAPSSVTEFIGVATPAVTPVSLGKPGKTP